MGQKPARKKGAPRLNITPELLADVRRRYEHTPERLATMAADLGCCVETLRAIAKREGWVRFEAPPRDLSPAARLRLRAEQLAAQGGAAFSPPPRGEGEGVGGVVVEPTRSPTATPLPDPQGGREKKEEGGGEKQSPAQGEEDVAVIAGEMLHEVRGFLDDVRAERQRMKRAGYAKHELQSVARVIHDCTAALARLQATTQRAAAAETAQQTDQEIAQENAYDDMPADLDEFRNALARRIDALLAEPEDAGDAAPAAGAGADPARP